MPFCQEEHISAIGIMSSAGLLDVGIVKGGTDGDAFYSAMQKHLLPHDAIQWC